MAARGTRSLRTRLVASDGVIRNAERRGPWAPVVQASRNPPEGVSAISTRGEPGGSYSRTWFGIVLSSVIVTAQAIAPAGTEAQLTSLRFRTWSLEDGMTHDAVYALHQDRSGLIWVGTQAGLLRFDGETFQPFLHDRDNSSSLSNDHIMAIHNDGEGGLWVGTLQGWLNRVDLVTGRVDRVAPPGLALEDGSGGRAVYGIVQLGSGHLGLATDLGAFVFDPSTRIHTPLGPGPTSGGRPDATAILADDDDVWVGYWDGELQRVSVSTPAVGVTVQRLGGQVSAIRTGPPGQIWVGTRGFGAFLIEADDHAVVTRLHSAGDDAHLLLHDRVQDVWLDRDGDLWVATIAGLSLFPGDGRQPTHFIENDADPWSLPDNLSIALLEDRQGVIWVGTVSGLGRVHPYDEAFTRFQARNAVRDGVAGGGVLAIADAGAGKVWVGTYGGGLDLLNLDDGSMNHWPPMVQSSSGPSHGEVKALAVHPDGTVWLATMGGGVNRFDIESGVFHRVEIQPSRPAVDVSFVTSILIDRTGSVWAGTQFDGLHRYDPQAGTFHRFRGDGTLNLGSDYVWPVIEDREGALWVGAFEGGLTRIDPNRSSAVTYTRATSPLRSDLLTTLFEGPRGDIWIGTEGAGVMRLNPKTVTIRTYTTSDGLPHNNIQAIRSDQEGNIWVSTNNGLARIDPDGRVMAFSQEAGLHGTRFYANAALTLPDGRLAFGGQGGLTVVDPRRIRLIEDPSPLVLTGFSVGGESRPVPNAGSANAIELGPTENFFTFRFAAIDYADPTRVEYRYMLDPLQSDWVDNGNSKVANYTSVPPGAYTFRLSAKNSFGVWNDEPLMIPVVVSPPYHATLWFRSLVLAAIASLLTAAYVYRMRQLQRVHDVRFTVAGQLHDNILGNLDAISMRTLELESAARGRSTSDSEEPTADDQEQLAQQLAVVNDILLDTASIVSDKLWVVKTGSDSVAGLFEKLKATAREQLPLVTLSYSSSRHPPSRAVDMSQRQEIHLLFKEALRNVARHSGASHVTIDVSYLHPSLHITIEDNGAGFERDDLDREHGLGVMEERAARAGGRLHIDSNSGHGTHIQLEVELHPPR